MKKIIYTIMYLVLSILLIFSIKSNAASLDTIDVKTDKTTIHPGENVVLSIDFGKKLGSYTFDIAYDKNIFEYVTTNGGTANDTGTKVRVYYFDQTGGTSPRTNMTMTFKAKTEITTSNPTDFSVTAEGLANEDASVSYDDITTPIKNNIVVEPVKNEEESNQTQKPENKTEEQEKTQTTEKKEELPTSLPKTGYNQYAFTIAIIILLSVIYIKTNKKN